ncbi:MAG: HAD-IIB family hydrolase [Patescibacteria group bacterium]
MKYKALIIDVDGTIVPNREDGLPSQKIIEAIARARGVMHVGVATSRPLFMLAHIFNLLDLSGPSIINGGAQIIDLPSRKTVWEQTLNGDDIKQVCSILQGLHVPFIIQDDGKDVPFSSSYVSQKPFHISSFELTPVKVDEVIQKVSLIPTVFVQKQLSWRKNKVGLMVSHISATKLHATYEVAKLLGIDTKEMIGIGDGYNDFPLLMACGLKIAMGNAVEDLKAIADFIVPSVEQDGVAHAINRFILK